MQKIPGYRIVIEKDGRIQILKDDIPEISLESPREKKVIGFAELAGKQVTIQGAALIPIESTKDELMKAALKGARLN